MSAGYSGTPLGKKLGLKPDMVAVCLNAPDDYGARLGDDFRQPPSVEGLQGGEDFIHLFTTLRAELDDVARQAFATMNRDGMLWVSWPKKASKVPTEITEDVIREICLPIGLVDVKVCAVSEIWSGLKLVIRKELR
ncbi:MAG: DUF3052 domain-containing protein [Pseudomonadota bacterium]